MNFILVEGKWFAFTKFFFPPGGSHFSRLKFVSSPGTGVVFPLDGITNEIDVMSALATDHANYSLLPCTEPHSIFMKKLARVKNGWKAGYFLR